MKKFEGSTPLIACSNLEWQQPSKMILINDFTDAIDKEKPEYV